MSVSGDVGEAGVGRMKAAVGFQSEEVPGRGSDCEQPCKDRRLPSFTGEWAVLTASPGDGGRAGGDSCIFVKLSSCGAVPWVGARPAEGGVRDRQG